MRGLSRTIVAIASMFLLVPFVMAAVSLPSTTPGTVKSVAIVNEIATDAMHTHIGITAFGNFEHVMPNDWGIPSFTEQAIRDTLQEHDITATSITLDAADHDLILGGQCYSKWNGRFKEECQERFRALLDRLHVDALITLSDYETRDMYTDSPNRVKGYGVFSRGGKRPKLSLVYAHIAMGIVGGNPTQPLRGAGCTSTEMESGRPWPKDAEALTLEDLAWARPVLEGLVKRRVHDSLVASGLIAGTFEECRLLWGRPR